MVDLSLFFREGNRAITKILSFYYPGQSWRSIRKEVLTEYLRHLASEGVLHQDLHNYFFKCSVDSRTIHRNYKDESFQPTLVPYSNDEITRLLIRNLGSVSSYNNLLFETYLKSQLYEMYSQGFFTKEELLDVLKGASQLPYLDPSDSVGLGGTAFRWIFELLYSPEIIRVLSSKDYGTLESGIVPVSLLKALNLYVEGNHDFNRMMKSRVLTVVREMFHTTNLTEIYMLLNTGIL